MKRPFRLDVFSAQPMLANAVAAESQQYFPEAAR
jgi:hypothetical protein